MATIVVTKDLAKIVATKSPAKIIAVAAQGPTGASGTGVPAGGVTGDVLVKNSATDGDVGWKLISPGMVVAGLVFG